MGCTCSITLKDNLTTFIQKCGAPSILIANKLYFCRLPDYKLSRLKLIQLSFSLFQRNSPFLYTNHLP